MRAVLFFRHSFFIAYTVFPTAPLGIKIPVWLQVHHHPVYSCVNTQLLEFGEEKYLPRLG